MGCTPSQPQSSVTPPLGVRWLGRAYSQPGGTLPATLGWPASGFEAVFSGSDLWMEARVSPLPGANAQPVEVWLSIQVDNGPPRAIPLAEGDWAGFLAKNLSDTLHRVRVRRRTESFTGLLQVRQLTLSEKGKWLAPNPQPHWFLFIGNSITCGYGIEGKEAACAFTPATENALETYAAHAARILGHEWQAIAYSGKGMYRNYDLTTHATLPDLWLKAWGESDAPVWEMDNEIPPSAVCVHLGTNDFARGMPEKQAFQGACHRLLKEIWQRYPAVPVVLLSGPMLSGQALKTKQQWLEEIASTYPPEAGHLIFTFSLTSQGPLGFGCGYHPNLAQNALNGAELAGFLAAMLHQSPAKKGRP